jgi:hypothetical protein
MPPDPAFIPFLVGAIGAVAAFAAYLVKDQISDLRKQRDTAVAGWQTQIDATNKLADALHERNAIDERMLTVLGRRQ